MLLKNWKYTFCAQRCTTDSSLSLYACLRYKSATISRMGSRGRPALLTPASTSYVLGPNKSKSTSLRPARARRANSGANDASISFHGIRGASTASGWRKSII